MAASESRAISWLWILAAAATFWSFGFTVMSGADLWWHVAGGRWAFENGIPPLLDPFSFTAAGQPWIADAWLSDLIFYLWSRAFGIESLVWWKWGIIVAAYLVLFVLLRRLCSRSALPAYLAALTAVAVAAPFLDLRPQLYSFLFLAILLLLTLGRERPPWWLPAIFLTWANLHAGVILGLLVLPIALLPRFLQGDAAQRRRLSSLIAISAASCLANPNGFKTFSQPLLYALEIDSPFRGIGEWLPPFAPGGIHAPLYPYALGVFGCAALATLAVRLAGGKRPAPWEGLLLGTLTLAMSLTSRRFIPVFGICLTLVLAPLLDSLLRPALQRLPRVLLLALPCLALGFGAYRLAPYPLSSSAFLHLTAQDRFPVETVSFIEHNHLFGNVFALYNWGGYLHLRTGGRVKVYIDGRANTVFDRETYERYLRVHETRPGWEQVVEDSDGDFFLWPRTGVAAHALIASGRWRLLYQDAVSSLLVRSDRMPRNLVTTPESAYRQLAEATDWIDRGRLSRARAHLERALEMDPNVGLISEKLARVQFISGEQVQGRETMRQAQKRFPDPDRARSFERWAGAISDSSTAPTPDES